MLGERPASTPAKIFSALFSANSPPDPLYDKYFICDDDILISTHGHKENELPIELNCVVLFIIVVDTCSHAYHSKHKTTTITRYTVTSYITNTIRN